MEQVVGYWKYLRWDKSGDRKGSEIQMESDCMFTIEPMRFPNEVHEQYEIKRGINDDSTIFGLNSCMRGKMAKVWQKTYYNWLLTIKEFGEVTCVMLLTLFLKHPQSRDNLATSKSFYSRKLYNASEPSFMENYLRIVAPEVGGIILHTAKSCWRQIRVST